ncbi:hypothetical protein G039_0314800 [Pseudomonas aeruginosa VRFPA01]|nr:hypothetical protein G039_0314800 [Pseudomonas aeruginosa VRFPA01]
MKLSDSFDARRLRPRRPRVWRWRPIGVLLALAGASALIGRQPAVGMMHIEPGAGGVLLALGLLSLWLGVFFWRFSRRRGRRNSDLSLSPSLMKKRD